MIDDTGYLIFTSPIAILSPTYYKRLSLSKKVEEQLAAGVVLNLYGDGTENSPFNGSFNELYANENCDADGPPAFSFFVHDNGKGIISTEDGIAPQASLNTRGNGHEYMWGMTMGF